MVAGAISSLGHDILGAQVYTSRSSLAMEIFQLVPIAGGTQEEEVERLRIEERVVAALAGDPGPSRGRSAQPALPAGRPRPPEVRFANDDSDFYTIIDLHANDRVGLLHDVTRTLVECDLDVVMARIATKAQRVVDAFYCTKDGKKISEPEEQERIERALLAAIRSSGA